MKDARGHSVDLDRSLRIARASSESGQYARALSQYDRLIGQLRSVDRLDDATGCALEATICAAGSGDVYLAAQYFDQANLLAIERGASLDTGAFAFAQAECSLARGNNRAALAEYTVAMERYVEADQFVESVGVMGRYAFVVASVGGAADAAKAHQQVVNAVRVLPQLGMRGELIAAKHLRESGRAHRREGDKDEAFAALLEASELFRDHGMLADAALLDLEVGSLAIELGDEDFARDCFLEAKIGFAALGRTRDLARASRALEYLGDSPEPTRDGFER